MDGILNIDKPWGETTFRVVALIKRLSGERRVGHAATLDPAATGVLPICLGKGTRVAEFLLNSSKIYRAQIELGTATDTYDASGRITHRGDPSNISLERLESVLNSFRGSIRQTPPMFSAIKHHGKPLYQLARAGITVDRKSRPTEIYRLELVEQQMPVFTVEVECSRGTYIRSLAHDLGEHLGCGAHLKSLIRLKCGVFHIADAISVPQLEEAFRGGYWQRFVHPIDIILQDWQAVIVSAETESAIRQGQQLELPEVDADRCRAYNAEGRFLGILRFLPELDKWQPEKVFI